MRFSIIIFTFILSFTLEAQTKAPNYNFKLQDLDKFMPGNKYPIDGIKVEEIVEYTRSGSYIIYRYKLKHLRYHFPLFIQVQNNRIIDFFAKLPTYFLHDTFHQSLINRHGKQNKYYKVEGNALYIWNNQKGIKYIYSGTCTITCFPLYLFAQEVQKQNSPKDYTSLLKLFSKS